MRNKRAGKEMTVTKLVDKERNHSLLGNELDKQVQARLTILCTNCAVVSTAIVMACAEGIVKSHDSNQLECNGGSISLAKDCAQYLMRFVKPAHRQRFLHQTSNS